MADKSAAWIPVERTGQKILLVKNAVTRPPEHPCACGCGLLTRNSRWATRDCCRRAHDLVSTSKARQARIAAGGKERNLGRWPSDAELRRQNRVAARDREVEVQAEAYRRRAN